MWDTLIVKPFAWLLLTLYEFTSSYGVAIILFSIVTRLIMLFFSAKGKKGMMQQQRLAPKQKELEKQFKNDKQKYNEALQKLYQDEGVSMMGGCLWMLLPFPVMIALYGVLRAPLTNLMKLAADKIQVIADYLGFSAISNGTFDELGLAQAMQTEFANHSGSFAAFLNKTGIVFNEINFYFLGLNLVQVPPLPWVELSPLILIPLLSGATAYLSSWATRKFNGQQQDPTQQGSMKMLNYTMPLISVVIGFSMPAALGLYWIMGNLLSIVQDYFLTKYYKKKFDAEDARKAALEERRRAAEAKLKEERRQEKLAAVEAHKNKHKVYRVSNQPGKSKQPPKGGQPKKGAEGEGN